MPKLKVGIHLRCKDQMNRVSEFVCYYASMLKNMLRLHPQCHTDRKANSMPEIFRPKCMEYTLIFHNIIIEIYLNCV